MYLKGHLILNLDLGEQSRFFRALLYKNMTVIKAVYGLWQLIFMDFI